MTLERKKTIILKIVCPEMEQNKIGYYNTPQRKRNERRFVKNFTKKFKRNLRLRLGGQYYLANS